MFSRNSGPDGEIFRIVPKNDRDVAWDSGGAGNNAEEPGTPLDDQPVSIGMKIPPFWGIFIPIDITETGPVVRLAVPIVSPQATPVLAKRLVREAGARPMTEADLDKLADSLVRTP